jgi:transcriptional antiterminator
MTSYKIIQTITNNMVRARDINDHEVILTGKGIGFGKRVNDLVPSNKVESTFSLVSKEEQQHFSELLRYTSPKLVELSNQMIQYIQSKVDKPLNEHIHVALTDHIAFLVRRCKMGLPIENPFSVETATLYPKEYSIAVEVMQMLSTKLNLKIPLGEAGLTAMHIISSVHDETMANIQESNRLISKLVSIIETRTGEKLDTNNLNYVRLITHIRFAIERIRRGETLNAPEDLVRHVREAYPQSYYFAWTLIRTIQREMHKNVEDAEVFYLSMHIYRYIQYKEVEQQGTASN